MTTDFGERKIVVSREWLSQLMEYLEPDERFTSPEIHEYHTYLRTQTGKYLYFVPQKAESKEEK